MSLHLYRQIIEARNNYLSEQVNKYLEEAGDTASLSECYSYIQFIHYKFYETLTSEVNDYLINRPAAIFGILESMSTFKIWLNNRGLLRRFPEEEK